MKGCFRLWFLIVLISINFSGSISAQTDFFANPQMVSDSEEYMDTKTIDMCWLFEANSFLRFITADNEIYFEICFKTLPETYGEQIRQLFVFRKEPKNSIFSYEWHSGRPAIINQPRAHTQSDANSPSYLLHERRVFGESTPQLIHEDELISIIRHHNILFYTGAGLSVASGVPTMQQLQDLLGLKAETEFAITLKNALENPEDLSKSILTFHNACFNSPPTNGHIALRKLAIFKNIKIVTENLDALHEASGIIPYRVNTEELLVVGGASLKIIDYVICCGLSFDDRGFLGWYKHHRPDGKIISIDLATPSYLGVEDYIIHADLQELLPSIANKIINLDANLASHTP